MDIKPLPQAPILPVSIDSDGKNLIGAIRNHAADSNRTVNQLLAAVKPQIAVAMANTTQNIPAAASTVVHFQLAYINTGTMFSPTLANRITVAKPGKYLVFGNVWVTTASPSARRLLSIAVNGAIAARVFDGLWGCDNDGTLPFPPVILELKSNDYLEMQIYTANAITIGGNGTGAVGSRFQVEWLGD